MSSVILRTATRYLVPLLLLFSWFLLLRGHDAPGGGFVGGLVAAAAFAVHALAFGAEETRASLRASPHALCAAGLALAFAAATMPLLVGEPLLTVQHAALRAGDLRLAASSALLFDIGVYVAVVGMALLAIFSLEEET